MVQHALTKRVLCIDPLDTSKVAGDLRCALAKSHDAVVEEGTSVSVGRVRINKSYREKWESGKEKVKLHANQRVISHNISPPIMAKPT